MFSRKNGNPVSYAVVVTIGRPVPLREEPDPVLSKNYGILPSFLAIENPSFGVLGCLDPRIRGEVAARACPDVINEARQVGIVGELRWQVDGEVEMQVPRNLSPCDGADPLPRARMTLKARKTLHFGDGDVPDPVKPMRSNDSGEVEDKAMGRTNATEDFVNRFAVVPLNSRVFVIVTHQSDFPRSQPTGVQAICVVGGGALLLRRSLASKRCMRNASTTSPHCTRIRRRSSPQPTSLSIRAENTGESF